MFRFKTSSFVFFFSIFSAYSQHFSGKILDAQTKKGIPFCNIYLVDYEVSTVSDSSGYFQFNLKLPRQVKIKISAFMYESYFSVVETNENVVFELKESHLEFDEVVVSSSKNEKYKNSVLPIELKKISELKLIPTSNLGEALANMTGVYNSSTGTGISKPVIRGLQGNRVVTYLNGLRIENQQWGGDHGMGINDLGIGQVEIIKGPSSLQFGGDALGGVIYLIDENFAKQHGQEIELQSQFESNTMGINNRISYKKSWRNIRLSLAALQANHADYLLPNAKFAGNTRFDEQNIKFALSFNQKNMISTLRYNFVNNHVGIPGESEDSIVNNSSFQYKNRARKIDAPYQAITNHFLSLESKYFHNKSELNFLLGQTVNQLSEFEQISANPSMKMTLNNTLYHLKYKYTLNEKLSFIAGLQGMFQQTKNSKLAEEFLIPNGTSSDNGIYGIIYYSYNKWNFQSGLRFDTRLLRSLQEFAGNSAISKNYSNLNYSFGAVRNSKVSSLRFNISNAYRAPHFSELLSNGVHHGTMHYEVGDSNLKTENATQLDVSYEYFNEHISLTINPYFSYFKNFIYSNPLDSLQENLPVFLYSQMKQAQIYGLDVGVHYHPHFTHFLHVESNFSTINIVGDSPNKIAMIPQSRINSFLKFSLKMKTKFKLEQIVLQHSFYFAQKQVALFEDKSKAYQLFNAALNFKWELKKAILFDVGFKNIFNETYINHLSRLKSIDMPNPGFNLYISIKFKI